MRFLELLAWLIKPDDLQVSVLLAVVVGGGVLLWWFTRHF